MLFLEDIDCDEAEITVEWEEECMDIHCPWMDCTARFELTDIGAINLYGEAFLRKWRRKANEVLKDEGLMKQLKEWSEKTSYMEKFPYRNPIERFGLVWRHSSSQPSKNKNNKSFLFCKRHIIRPCFLKILLYDS